MAARRVLNQLLVSSQQSLVISDRDSREQSQNCSAIGPRLIATPPLAFWLLPKAKSTSPISVINFTYNEFQIFREI
ncbi:MAG: hypothetical protein U7126_17775 [Microcoleus sp.]